MVYDDALYKSTFTLLCFTPSSLQLRVLIQVFGSQRLMGSPVGRLLEAGRRRHIGRLSSASDVSNVFSPDFELNGEVNEDDDDDDFDVRSMSSQPSTMSQDSSSTTYDTRSELCGAELQQFPERPPRTDEASRKRRWQMKRVSSLHDDDDHDHAFKYRQKRLVCRPSWVPAMKYSHFCH